MNNDRIRNVVTLKKFVLTVNPSQGTFLLYIWYAKWFTSE